MLQAGCFENASDAHVEIFDSIKGYYNTHRKYSAIGYKTPSQFEAQFHHAEQPTKRSKNQLHLRFSYALTKFIAAKAPTSTRLV